MDINKKRILTCLLSELKDYPNAEEQILNNEDFRHIGFNSITYIKAILRIEKSLSIRFEDKIIDNEELMNWDNMKRYIEEKLKLGEIN